MSDEIIILDKIIIVNAGKNRSRECKQMTGKSEVHFPIPSLRRKNQRTDRCYLKAQPPGYPALS